METKVCTKCGIEYPAISEYWHKLKRGKYGLRSVCKKCNKEYRKIYCQFPDNKEKHRIKMAIYRQNNRERTNEITRLSYKRNGHKYNERKKILLKEDPIFKMKVIERERKYKESGRRYEVNNKPDQRLKARERLKKRRQNPTLKAMDYERNAKWRNENRLHIKELTKIKIDELKNSYVAAILGFKVNELPIELIEVKRLIIKTHRLCKTSQNYGTV